MNTLPIATKRSEICDAVRQNKVAIVTGEAGCGKTTELPIILHEMGFSRKGTIVVAEPRRAAAIATAEYVASRIGSPLGEQVGYHVRYGNVNVFGAAIKFVTNGILLRELFSGSLFERYSAVIIDEAHERSIEMDLLLGLAKRAVRIRGDLRVVVASATLNAPALSEFFDGCPVIDIPGRPFPVTIHYHRRTLPRIEWMVRAVAKKIISIVRETKAGDILAFMPGRESIAAVIAEVWNLAQERIITLPFHKDMEVNEYCRLFEEFPGMRKVIIATNIAETSLTFPSVRFVVDSGLIKEVDYDTKTGIERLGLVSHSQSGCAQRSGRVGRVSEGICYRLYPETAFQDRSLYTEPEITRRKLDWVVLYLKALGFSEPLFFEWVTRPSGTALEQAKGELIALDALSSAGGELTDEGKLMAILPLQPFAGRLVVEAIRRGCVREILTYTAFLTSPRVFLHPWGEEKQARRMHEQFFVPHSDVLTLLKVWDAYADSGQSKEWCEEHFFCHHALAEVASARVQISRTLLERNVGMSRAPSESVLIQTIAAVQKGYLCKHEGKGWYRGVFRDVGKVRIHPGSALGKTVPDYLVAGSIIEIEQRYAAQCTAIEGEILKAILPQSTTSAPNAPAKQQAKTAAPSSKKVVVNEKTTLLFVQKNGKLISWYRGKCLQKLERKSCTPVPGKLYRARVFSDAEGTLSVLLFNEVVPGEKARHAMPKSKEPVNAELSEKTTDLAHDLASSWQCRLDD